MLFIVGFDGAIAPIDTVDALLKRFADPVWRRFEKRRIDGQLNFRQCRRPQFALIRADREEVEEFLRAVPIDPFFSDFVTYASMFADVAVVSDSLDYTIWRALERLSLLLLPVYANRLEFETRGLGIAFPYAQGGCAQQSGVCKCEVARELDDGRGRSIVLIGAGWSDRCLARSAKYVFAKGSLRAFCEDEGITHTPFESFDDVLAEIRKWGSDQFKQRVRDGAPPRSALN